MSFFSNADFFNKMTETDYVINEDLRNSKNSNGLIDLDSDHNKLSVEHNLFFTAILTTVWQDFYRILKTNPSKLDKYTPFNQENMGFVE